MKNLILLSICSLLLLASCRPTKQVIQSVISPRDTTSPVASTSPVRNQFSDSVAGVIKTKHINFNTFSSKIKIESSDNNGKNPDITALVKIQADSSIWISLTATFLNVEVYRLYISKDSVVLLDKREKTVQYRSLDYLQTVTEIPFDYTSLQDLIVGNAIFYDADKANNVLSNTEILSSFIGQEFKHLLTLDANNFHLIHSKLDDINENRHRTSDVSYSDYVMVDGYDFSAKRKITVAEKNKIQVSMEFNKAEFNKPLEINFTVPKNYTIK